MKKSIKNILILHDSGAGDFIIMSAVIREIRRIYVNAHITLMINKFSSPLAICCPYVDEIYPADDFILSSSNELINYREKLPSIVKPLLDYNFDISFNFAHYPSSQLIAYYSGAKERVDIGVAGANTDFNFNSLTTFIPNWKGFNKFHYNDRFLHTLKTFSKTNIKNRSLEIWLSPIDKFFARSQLTDVKNENLIAIVPGGNIKLSAKRWSADNFAELMNLILSNQSAYFILLGGIEDIESANIIQSKVDNHHLKNFVGKIDYRQSAAILNRCKYYIGNDTGLLHVASALKIPVLSPNCFPAELNMTASSFPALYFPYDVPSVIVQPKHAIDNCKHSKSAVGCIADNSHCINQISPINMFEAFNLLMNRIDKNITVPLFIPV